MVAKKLIGQDFVTKVTLKTVRLSESVSHMSVFDLQMSDPRGIMVLETGKQVPRSKRKESKMTFTYKIKTGNGHEVVVLAPANVDPTIFLSETVEILNVETVGVS